MATIVLIIMTGVVIIFSVLILLLLLIMHKKNSGGSNNNIMENNTIPLPIANNSTAVNNYELIAVITAALAASLGTSPDRLVVRSLRQVRNDDKSAWRSSAKSDSQHKINQWR